jgi:hypothetical protein
MMNTTLPFDLPYAYPPSCPFQRPGVNGAQIMGVLTAQGPFDCMKVACDHFGFGSSVVVLS